MIAISQYEQNHSLHSQQILALYKRTKSMNWENRTLSLFALRIVLLVWEQQSAINPLMLRLETSISFQIVNFNYEIINKEFENNKAWEVFLKSSTTFITMVNLAQI